jgi:hypothetical protein
MAAIKPGISSFHPHPFEATPMGDSCEESDINGNSPVPDVPSDCELRESVEAIRRALSDMACGDCGILADDVIAKLRSKYGLPLG